MSKLHDFEQANKYLHNALKIIISGNAAMLACNMTANHVPAVKYMHAADEHDLTELAGYIDCVSDANMNMSEKFALAYIKSLIMAIMHQRKSHACYLIQGLADMDVLADDVRAVMNNMLDNMDNALEIFNANFGAIDAPYLDMHTSPDSIFAPALTQIGKILTADATMLEHWQV